ncbi:MAG: RNA polymerase sigma factor [Pseudomonadales bacterium]
MASFADIHLDSGIARGLQRGDRRAQAVAYRLMSPTIMGLAVRILQDEGLAQEVVQDTFVELIDKAHTLNDPAAVVGWVRRVAVNHCYMRLRSPWHKRRSAEEAAPEPVDPGCGAERLDGYRDLERALSGLAPETRLVIWLHDVEGYTHREIGELTGQTASYSKSQLSRGYEKLLRMTRGNEDNGTATDSDALKPACAP